MYFCLQQAANSKFAAKTAKRKPENTSIFRKETSQKIDSDMNEEEYHSQSSFTKFYYSEDLETSKAGISESQEAIDDFINKQKSENTRKKTTADMNTLFRFIEANG